MARYIMFVTILLLVARSAMAQTWADPNCSDVVWDFLPCMNFLQGLERAPSWGCCHQLKDLNKTAKGKERRMRIYQCIQDLAAETGSLISSRVHALSGKCRLHPKFPISTKIECSLI